MMPPAKFILPDTTWTLYEWNERNNQYEVSTKLQKSRAAKMVTTL